MKNCLGHEHLLSKSDLATWLGRADTKAARAWVLPPADVMIGGVSGWRESTLRVWLAGHRSFVAPVDPWVPPCVAQSG